MTMRKEEHGHPDFLVALSPRDHHGMLVRARRCVCHAVCRKCFRLSVPAPRATVVVTCVRVLLPGVPIPHAHLAEPTEPMTCNC